MAKKKRAKKKAAKKKAAKKKVAKKKSTKKKKKHGKKPKKKATGLQSVPVTISLKVDGTLLIDPDPRHCHISHPPEQVVWDTEPPGLPFDVEFKVDSAFRHRHFDQDHPKSGPVTNGTVGKFYAYRVDAFGVSVDPDVIIDS